MIQLELHAGEVEFHLSRFANSDLRQISLISRTRQRNAWFFSFAKMTSTIGIPIKLLNEATVRAPFSSQFYSFNVANISARDMS
jgi:hypothetical protein